MKTATLSLESACPDCSYRTNSPAVTLCPLCNVPLILQERTWADGRQPLRTHLSMQTHALGNRPIQVAVLDLGFFGARLALREPLQTGRRYALTLPVPDGAQALRLSLRVLSSGVRCPDTRCNPGMIHHSGVEFQNLPPAVDRALAAYLGGPGGTCPGPLQGSVAPLPE